MLEPNCELCGLANVLLQEHANGISSLALQDLGAAKGRYSVSAASTEALDLVRVEKETADASVAEWNLAKNSLAGNHNKSCTILKSLKSDLVAICKLAICQAALQLEYLDAQHSCSELYSH